jgi:hypothetical protein
MTPSEATTYKGRVVHHFIESTVSWEERMALTCCGDGSSAPLDPVW